MGVLITLADIKVFRPVSSNLENDRLDPLIEEAQDFDIKPVLGPALFLDMVNNINDQIYVDLFNGTEYLDKSLDANIEFKGVKAALAYYSYARLLLNQDFHVSGSGLVHKDEEWSKNVEEKRIQRQVTAARLAAGAHEKEYLRFLQENSTDYPIYLKSCVTSNASVAGITISRVTKGDRYRRHNHRCGNCGMFGRYCTC